MTTSSSHGAGSSWSNGGPREEVLAVRPSGHPWTTEAEAAMLSTCFVVMLVARTF